MFEGGSFMRRKKCFRIGFIDEEERCVVFNSNIILMLYYDVIYMLFYDVILLMFVLGKVLFRFYFIG